MSVTGRKPSTVISVINAAISGQTVAGAAVTVTLKPSADPLDPVRDPTNCADGGYVLLVERCRAGNTAAVNQTSGGRVQRRYDLTILLRFAYAVGACDPANLVADRIIIVEKTIDLIEAALEPQTGANYSMAGHSFTEPRFNREGGNFYVQDIRIEVQEYWARS